ncbi:MAG TPA: RnfABCDGE type electron transport complex subunit D, partial [Planctomycetota bacterium]|nr:RnfABCDGE type electron transport complex subunit D [Planctomycetota bacterium]
RIMWSVVLALVPALVGALFIFGYYAGVVVIVCVASCMFFEAVIQSIRKVPVTVTDGSAAVTGMLLAFILPPDVPLWIPVLGALIAVGLAKQLFGGLGHNIWNPALVARAVLQLSAPDFINHGGGWPVLRDGSVFGRLAMNVTSAADAVTQASPLSMSSASGIADYHYDVSFTTDAATSWRLWLGFEPGSLGETSFILLALGGVALILLKRIKWQVPVFYIGTVALLTWMLPYSKASFPPTEGFFNGHPLYHVAFGGLALGAFFMATDMVTTPLTTLGQVVFATGCGVLTAVIRLYGGYPEGVCYSILIMNTAVPLIDRFTRVRVFGTRGVKRA